MMISYDRSFLLQKGTAGHETTENAVLPEDAGLELKQNQGNLHAAN